MSRKKRRKSDRSMESSAHQNSPPDQAAAPRPTRPLWTFRSLGLTVLLAIVIGLVARQYMPNGNAREAAADPAAAAGELRKFADIPFDADQAQKYLVQLCDLGPRPSGSEKMHEQQKLLEGHFKKLGAQVSRQDFRTRHPLEGEKFVTMTNLIVQWQPEKKERILLCAHYDTRPYPDRDKKNRQGRFVGANDGASGTALLMALGDQMPKVECKYGVDFVLFDGEELVFRTGDRDWGEYFLGADWFAREYRKAQVEGAKFSYKYGVLFDMVGDKDLNLFLERNSMDWEDTRPLMNQIWSVARRLGVREFINKPKYDIRDDHLPLHEIGKIPCIDIIDFDYPHWHTEQDTADKCSGESLAKVGKVILEWMRTVE